MNAPAAMPTDTDMEDLARMRFLWLTRFPPYPPLRGGDIEYSRELAHSLARSAQVQGLAYAADGVTIPADSPLPWETVAYRRPSPLFGLASSLPDVAFRFQTDAYLKRALALAGKADAVIVDFIGMAWIVEPLRAALSRAGRDVPVIMITHNHEGAMRRMAARGTRFPRSIMLGYDAYKADRLERRANRLASGLTAIIAEDAAAFRQSLDTPIEVLLPGYKGPVVAERSITAETPRRAAIIGNRSSSHKVTVLEHALAAFAAAGTDAAVAIEVCGAGDMAGSALRYPKVAFKGFVDDMPAYLADVRLALIPDDLGGGFKMRALTLASLRVPILGLRSAMVGTTFEPGVHYHAVDTLAEMAAAMPALIEDQDRLNSLQEAAFRHCQSHFDWDERGVRLAQFTQRLKVGGGH